jgi:hypothetical protein
MKKTLNIISLSVVVMSAPTYAYNAESSSTISEALRESKVNMIFRTRYEGVDQEGIDKDANSITLKSRISAKTGRYNGLSVLVEVDNNTTILDDFNSTSNGKVQYPVVADPEGSDINQAYLEYKKGKLTIIGGRQRILHTNQRFVGGVAWRQNEQTYDGFRAKFKVNDAVSFDYSYIHNINRIFGPRGAKADLKGSFSLFNADLKINKDHKISPFAYILDFDTAASLSTSTYGFLYKGKFNSLNINASYAHQSDNADNPNAFDTNYYNVEISSKIGTMTILGGMDVLGSDNRVGFSTPLATLHKFQGFTDKFLGTPENGVEDLYLTVKTKVSNIKLAATYHDLSSNKGSLDYGTELDLVAAYAFNQNYSVLFKYASYDADSHASDTDKLWLQLMAKF